ncbi:3-oxoacyl-ACP reductase FabG [Pelobacter propionicus]|uniref:Short-chain dehydrogenase/reductase SDR n=1 Tax=Pelobacter propionicus (strain DSM 2379 / NBRC 103807 / OttBd1) TaxID=338966 RepID=A1AMG4_PELPD|nr:3-oxoacyl-ACP reductase FabG [Pelobacter propionicus]ABK98534.1 short-chain dehydrogenase/reductase SDR [Pelobacter propionicus DSM 2379]
MKTALVIGGSRGIGRAITLRLAESGFAIWLTYRNNHEAARGVQQEIEAAGGSCDLIPFDVSSYEETEAALAERLERVSPDVLVYNSGIARDNLLMWMTKDEWNSVISTNLNGFFNVTRQVVFAMLKARRGRIVVISSTSGQVGQPGQVNYSASKAGLIGAAKALAREVGKKKISVNVVAPGFIETEMTTEIPREQVLPLIPLNRVGTADDVASVVNFLCTEEHMYIHGQVIGVNGGLAM